MTKKFLLILFILNVQHHKKRQMYPQGVTCSVSNKQILWYRRQGTNKDLLENNFPI